MIDVTKMTPAELALGIHLHPSPRTRPAVEACITQLVNLAEVAEEALRMVTAEHIRDDESKDMLLECVTPTERTDAMVRNGATVEWLDAWGSAAAAYALAEAKQEEGCDETH